MTPNAGYRYGFAMRPTERLGTVVDVPRHDLVLWIIPAAFLLALLATNVFAVDAHVALVGAALLGAFAIADAVALNPPTEPA